MFDAEHPLSVRISKQHYDYLLTFPTLSEGIRTCINETMINDGLTPRKLKLTDISAKKLYKKLAKEGYEEVLS